MLKVLIATVLVVLCSTGLAVAVPLNLTLPCPNSGSVAVAGDYNPFTGAFSFTFTVAGCQKGTTTYNGSVNSSGTFVFSSPSTAQVNVSATSTITAVTPQAQGTQNCTVQFAGSYNLGTETLNGSANHNCTTTGQTSADVVELLSGLDIF